MEDFKFEIERGIRFYENATQLSLFKGRLLIGFVVISECAMQDERLDILTEEEFYELKNGEDKYLSLERAFVYPQYRRTGYGHKLLKYCFDNFIPSEFPDYTMITLMASPDPNVLSLKDVMRFYSVYDFEELPEPRPNNYTATMIKFL